MDGIVGVNLGKNMAQVDAVCIFLQNDSFYCANIDILQAADYCAGMRALGNLSVLL